MQAVGSLPHLISFILLFLIFSRLLWAPHPSLYISSELFLPHSSLSPSNLAEEKLEVAGYVQFILTTLPSHVSVEHIVDIAAHLPPEWDFFIEVKQEMKNRNQNIYTLEDRVHKKKEERARRGKRAQKEKRGQ